DDAGDDVGRPAGCEWNDEPDRAYRIGLGRGSARGRYGQRKQDQSTRETSHDVSSSLPNCIAPACANALSHPARHTTRRTGVVGADASHCAPRQHGRASRFYVSAQIGCCTQEFGGMLAGTQTSPCDMTPRPAATPSSLPQCAAPDPATRPPGFAMPPGAVDCHGHVFGPPARYPYAAARLYGPPP